MPIWLDRRYVNMVAPRLQLFKWKKPNLANFRCPFCGDSQKNKRRARGYMYIRDGSMFYKCWNCTESTNLSNFLKQLDPQLHLEYMRESFAEKNHTTVVVEEAPPVRVEEKREFVPIESLKHCVFVSELPEEHYAKAYLRGRNIPVHFDHWALVYTENIKRFVSDNFDPSQEYLPETPAIGILIFDAGARLVGCNCRSLKPESFASKYIKAKVNEDVKLIFGIADFNDLEDVFVFEGEFNSMFVRNSIAVGGVSNMFGIEKTLGVNKQSTIMVVDNDPRNKEVVKQMERLVDEGYRVVIFPGNVTSEDVNDLVLEHKLESIENFLLENTYSGLSAKLKLTEWKKI